MKKDKNQLILQMSYRTLLLNLLLSQLFFLLLGIGLSYLLFDSLTDWIGLMAWNPYELIIYGFLPGITVVLIDLFLIKAFPSKWFDDGGLNNKLFKEAPVLHIFGITLLVAIAEEVLFRGVIQTIYGIYAASFLFAMVHFRYLRKPFLFLSVLFLSFALGFVYKWTHNILVPITMHFTIDFVLGWIIHRRMNTSEQ